jgi:putative PIN family toxin of toxin-antitoxin system
VTAQDIQAIIGLIALRGELIASLHQFELCRDPQDNYLLDIGFAAQADVIVSGDEDLLVLHPFERIGIVTPRAFLMQLAQE